MARRRSQLILRNKAALADMGSRKGIKNVKIKISALRQVFPSERKRIKKQRDKINLAGKRGGQV